jgi:hypothetical protein
MKMRVRARAKDVENKYRLKSNDEGLTLDNFNFLGKNRFLNTRKNKKIILRKRRNKRIDTYFKKERDFSTAYCNFNLKKLKNSQYLKTSNHELISEIKAAENSDLNILEKPKAPQNTTNFIIENYRSEGLDKIREDSDLDDEICIPGGSMIGLIDQYIELNNVHIPQEYDDTRNASEIDDCSNSVSVGIYFTEDMGRISLMNEDTVTDMSDIDDNLIGLSTLTSATDSSTYPSTDCNNKITNKILKTIYQNECGLKTNEIAYNLDNLIKFKEEE